MIQVATSKNKNKRGKKRNTAAPRSHGGNERKKARAEKVVSKRVGRNQGKGGPLLATESGKITKSKRGTSRQVKTETEIKSDKESPKPKSEKKNEETNGPRKENDSHI